jgi:hypothetical protein
LPSKFYYKTLKRCAGLSLLTILLTIFCCCGAQANDFTHSIKPTILVLHSLKAKQPWTLLFNRYFSEALENSKLPSYKLEIECLDLLEFSDQEHKEILKKLLDHRYGEVTTDILVVTFDPAVHFVEETNLFPDAPRIVVLPSESTATHMANAVMLPFADDFKGNIEHCLDLLPDTKEIYVVAGNALFDKRTTEKFKNDTKDLRKRVSFQYLVGLGVEETMARVKELPPHSLVYYLSYTLDSNGKTVVARDFSTLLGQNANRPVMTYFDLFALNTHILGGRTTTTKASAVATVEVIEQLVQGESIASISPPAPFFDYIYDWPKLRKWGITESKLPSGSIIQNRPEFYERYFWQIFWGVFLLVVVSFFLIASLLTSIKRRKKVELEREKLIEDLKKTINEIELLRGILPICSFCKNVRNDEGYYEQIESYFHKHSGVDFSHTICPDCMKEHYSEEYENIVLKKKEKD